MRYINLLFAYLLTAAENIDIIIEKDLIDDEYNCSIGNLFQSLLAFNCVFNAPFRLLP